jgi:hypothetical protein
MTAKRTARKATTLARMMLAIPAATVTVLSKRLPMLAEAAVDPKQRNRLEEERMVEEKVTAGIEAGAATSQALFTGGLAIANAWWKAVGGLTSAPSAKGGRATDGNALGSDWQKLADTSIDAAITATTAAIRPAHRKVTANARRLGKSKSGS